jgi:hypothetical protein
MGWYQVVTSDISKLDDCINFYDAEYELGRPECKLFGNLEKASMSLPGIVENRYSQLQEIEAILEYLNIELKQVRSHHFKKYLETYARALSSRDCEKYVDGESDVVEFEKIINQFALLRNKYLSIIKALDQKQWQITNIVRLRCAGLEDATL